MADFLATETLIIGLLLIVSLVAIAVQRLRIPYTVALVIAGLVITVGQPLDFQLTPELILALFVPPLAFEAAFHINGRALWRDLPGILVLAVPGVLLTMLIVAGLVAVGTGLALPVALVFGALIAATDPVAVVALFRTLNAPRRLSLLIEGESLLNDGTAIVLFNLVLAAALTGQFSPIKGVVDFVVVSAGGVAIGLGLGYLTARVLARVDDYLIETTLTTVLAFGSYLAAEQLHVSGVLAVVAAGLVCGNLGPRGMSPTTRIVLYSFWEYVAFLANSLVFLLIGLEVDLPQLAAAWSAVLWAIAAVLAARVAVIWGLGWLIDRLGEPVPARWRLVLFWGGLRGAISLALALSLPAALGADRDLLVVMTYGVVLFTLLVQGVTMRPLLDRVGVVVQSERQVAYEAQRARLTALQAAVRRLDGLHHDGLLSAAALEQLKPPLLDRIGATADAVRQALRADPALAAQELDAARQEALRAQRGALQDLRRDGLISDAVFDELVTEVDAELSAVETHTAPEVEGEEPTPSRAGG
jgi:Na+:H+ antiporter